MLESYTSTYPRPRFWSALAEGRFELPRCVTCDEWQAPGSMACARCGSERLTWRAASGSGTVYSLLERHAAPGGQAAFILVVVLLEGPLVMGIMAGAAPHAEVGMRVHAVIPSAPSAEGLAQFAESAI